MKRGLVLSGGAAWGLANIGVLHVFERENITFDCIAGSSMGAIVAGAYALGISVQEIDRIATKISMLSLVTFSEKPLAGGLHGGLLNQSLESILHETVGDSVIGDCKIPFVCVAGKVKKPVDWLAIWRPGFTEHFLDAVEPFFFPPETRMIDALMASSALPIIFSPVRVGDDTFVDLVHFGSIPARRLRSLHSPDVVIGTDTSPRYDKVGKFLPEAWKEFIRRGHDEMDADRSACDAVIVPVMPKAVFRFDRAAEFIEAGRLEAEKSLPELRKVLKLDAQQAGKRIS